MISQGSFSKIALGTVQFGIPYGVTNSTGIVTKPEVNKILHLARMFGVSTLDTAIAYGDSESVLGESGVSDLKIVTKLPEYSGDSAGLEAWLFGELEQSCDRLGVSQLDGVLLHKPEQLKVPSIGNALGRFLNKARDTGITRKVGVSAYSPKDLFDTNEILDFDLVQVPMNVMDRRFASEKCERFYSENGIEVHIRSIFLQGLLLQTADRLQPKFFAWRKWWERWADWLACNETNALSACLSYPLSRSFVDKVVVGVTSAKEFEDILSQCEKLGPAPPDDFEISDLSLINPASWS